MKSTTQIEEIGRRIAEWRIAGERLAIELGAAVFEVLVNEEPAPVTVPVTRARKTRKNRVGRRKGFKMSAEAKAKISAAAKRRWAARKKAERQK